jgi:uncharacterized MnhB-related membrane protein
VRAETARAIGFGATVVAALLWFAAFVALFRHDLGDPLVAAGTFAAVGVLVFLAGYVIASRSTRR